MVLTGQVPSSKSHPWTIPNDRHLRLWQAGSVVAIGPPAPVPFQMPPNTRRNALDDAGFVYHRWGPVAKGRSKR